MTALQILPIITVIIVCVFFGGTMGGASGRSEDVEFGALLGFFLGCSLSLIYIGLVF